MLVLSSFRIKIKYQEIEAYLAKLIWINEWLQQMTVYVGTVYAIAYALQCQVAFQGLSVSCVSKSLIYVRECGRQGSNRETPGAIWESWDFHLRHWDRCLSDTLAPAHTPCPLLPLLLTPSCTHIPNFTLSFQHTHKHFAVPRQIQRSRGQGGLKAPGRPGDRLSVGESDCGRMGLNAETHCRGGYRSIGFRL